MVFYATDGSKPGYVHFTARLTGETLQPMDQWRQLNKDADIAFRGLMDEYKIALQPGVTVAAAAEAAPAVKRASDAAVPAAKEQSQNLQRYSRTQAKNWLRWIHPPSQQY